MINKRDNFKLRQEPLKSIKLREFFTKLWIFLNNVLILEWVNLDDFVLILKIPKTTFLFLTKKLTLYAFFSLKNIKSSLNN